jgi:hypothetical protein
MLPIVISKNALKVEGEKGRTFEINLDSEHGITLKKRITGSSQRTKEKKSRTPISNTS